MDEKTLLEFLGDKKKIPSIGKCREMLVKWRRLYPEYQVTERLDAMEIYLDILHNIVINERRAYNDAVERMRLPYDLA